MKYTIHLLVLNILNIDCLIQEQDPDQFNDALTIIRSRGFIAEEHNTVTPDGYILTLHRIINPYTEKNNYIKPLLLVHGILASSTDWLMNTHGFIHSDGEYIEDRYRSPTAFRELNGKMVPIGGSLGFVLSQFGYDVWLGNTRGTTYSRNHTFLNAKTDSQYWSFSLDEISMYDIPTLVNHVLYDTQKESLGYICHSQGCSVMFSFLSSKPSYSKVITDFIALAPVVFPINTYGGIPLRLIAPLYPVFRAIPIGILTPIQKQLLLQGKLCRDNGLRYVCGLLLQLITGFNPKQMDYERIAAFASHFPSGVSTWVLSHFAQRSISGRFQMFDYGFKNNFAKYGQSEPPDYPLSKITLRRISIFYSINDAISEYTDVLRIKNYLKVPLLSENLIMDPKFGHYDFFAHKRVGLLINSKIIDILRYKSPQIDHIHESDYHLLNSFRNEVIDQNIKQIDL